MRPLSTCILSMKERSRMEDSILSIIRHPALFPGQRSYIVALLLLLGLMATMVIAAPQNPNEITIVRQEESNNIGIGGYRFSYEQSDGQMREETAEIKNEGTENEILSVVGSFSFVGLDGKTYKVTYTADENGFHPTITLA
ncbi:hypothetical protein PV325_010491 [Microctonus aethiopoides]|nr:hypothetical protein PV325_010491 [Microctonus aethiopoides]